MISVADAIHIGAFRDCTVVAGHSGLNRPIRWAVILELLIETNLLQEGDLLITTAFGLEHNTALLGELIPKLSRQKLAGIAIQTGHYLNQIPPSIIEQCNHFSLPLIQLPKHLSFGEITKSLLKPIINKQMELLEYGQQINSRFMEIVLANQGFQKIADVLENLIQCPVRILDKDFKLIVHAGLDQSSCVIGQNNLNDEYATLTQLRLLPDIKKAARAICEIPLLAPSLPRQIISPLVAGNIIHGFLSVLPPAGRSLSDMDVSALATAATVSTLEMLKQISVMETENRIQGEFLEELVNGSYKSMESMCSRAKYLGYDFTESFAVLLINIDDFSAKISRKNEDEVQQIKSKLVALIRQNLSGRKAMLAPKSDKITILLQMPRDDYVPQVQQLAGQLIKTVAVEMSITISIGVGHCYRDLVRFPDSLKEAEKALLFRNRLDKTGALVFYEHLGLHRLFLGASDPSELNKFYNTVAKKLVDYDAIHETELIKTLQAFLRNNGEIKATAESLFIHRHTLTYRLDRIHKLTGLNPFNLQDNFTLQMGIIAADVVACL